MAEEKNTKNKDKEVKMEKRFCTHCGKELKEGESCSCGATPEVVSVNTDIIVNTSKNVFNTIINTFKKPDTTINKEISNKNNDNSIIIIILLAISFALYLMAVVSTSVGGAISSLDNISYGLTSSIDISYFKIFIYGLLIYGLMALIPMFAAFLIAKITKNNNYTFKKSFKLYTISNAPLIFAYAIMALILLINVSLLTILGFIAFAIISISCFFNFLLGFNKETKIHEDRRSYALTSILIVWVVIEVIAFLLIIGSAFSDIIDYNWNTNRNPYHHNTNW